MSTPIARVAAYVSIARLRDVDLVDALAYATPDQPRRVELLASDLAALVALHDELCPDVEHCEACGATLCATHGIGEAADCPADQVHCGGDSAWCWCTACMDAHREDLAVDAADDEVACP